MTEYQFFHILGQICGIIIGDYLLSIIIAALTHKRYFTKGYYKEEDYLTYRRRKIHVLYWSILSIYTIINEFRAVNSPYYRGEHPFSLFLWVLIVTWVIKGAYLLIRKLFIKGQAVPEIVKERYEDFTQKINKKEEPKKEEEPKPRSENLSESEEYWGLISFAYGKIKQTNIFKLWRKEQFDCQFGKCAICGKPMELRFSQVDHIKPRYKKGTNYSNNLALVHKKCNELKGAKTGYERPSWIKDNKYSEKLDEKAYEITEKIRADYPTKFPDELFKKPTKS